MSELFTIRPLWRGETCAVLGSGPSMSHALAAQLRGRCRVVAVNNQGVRVGDVDAVAPWADVLYAADSMWWTHNRDEAAKFAGLKLTMMPNGYMDFTHPVEGVRYLGNGGPMGFDDRRDHIRSGGNSGYQAVHVAAHFGAARILLLGFDMHARDGQHWHEDHKWRQGYESRYPLFINAFQSIAYELHLRGVDVVNCTPGSALRCFRHMTLEEALDGVQHLREGAEGDTLGARAEGTRGDRAAACGSQAAAEA